mmetsp:Transcript_24977/g.53856  ORF Transcript_24977/g.53856 Transcript_24977/m.53856 type:complete len:230 (+) Transcript_24977:1077-1766(+)
MGIVKLAESLHSKVVDKTTIHDSLSSCFQFLLHKLLFGTIVSNISNVNISQHNVKPISRQSPKPDFVRGVGKVPHLNDVCSAFRSVTATTSIFCLGPGDLFVHSKKLLFLHAIDRAKLSGDSSFIFHACIVDALPGVHMCHSTNIFSSSVGVHVFLVQNKIQKVRTILWPLCTFGFRSTLISSVVPAPTSITFPESILGHIFLKSQVPNPHLTVVGVSTSDRVEGRRFY